VASPVIKKKNKWDHQLQAYNTTPPVSFHLDSLATSITVTVTAQTKEKENYIPNATSIYSNRIR